MALRIGLDVGRRNKVDVDDSTRRIRCGATFAMAIFSNTSRQISYVSQIGGSMLRLLAGSILFACASTVAWADAAADCAHAKSFDDQIRACTTIISSNPRAGWAYTNRSYAYERIEKYDRAIEDGNRAVMLSPRDPFAYINRAAGYIGQKEYDTAMADLRKALAISPGNATAFVNRAYVYEQLGERDRAIADYRRVLEIDSSSKFAKDSLKRLDAEP
jgi:tetratricopeptide (TPR) repeat protein